jgi:hypothetical protein
MAATASTSLLKGSGIAVGSVSSPTGPNDGLLWEPEARAQGENIGSIMGDLRNRWKCYSTDWEFGLGLMAPATYVSYLQSCTCVWLWFSWFIAARCGGNYDSSAYIYICTRKITTRCLGVRTNGCHFNFSFLCTKLHRVVDHLPAVGHVIAYLVGISSLRQSSLHSHLENRSQMKQTINLVDHRSWQLQRFAESSRCVTVCAPDFTG